MAFEFFNKLFDFTPKPAFKNGGIAIVEATPEQIEERWDKKKEAIEILANNIRKLKYNVSRELKSENEKDFLTALVLAIILKTGERVGNDDSADEGHFGVTGFLKRHIKISSNEVTISYTGKSGVDQVKSFTDATIAEALKKAIKNSPDKTVFTTSDGFSVKSDRINRFLEPYNLSAKDIRGFSCNQWIIKKLNNISPEALKEADDEKKRQKLFNGVARAVAEKIGHGLATCKKHYMLPELEDSFVKDGTVIDLTEFYSGGEVDKK